MLHRAEVIDGIAKIRRYFRVYKNAPSVVRQILVSKFPIRAELRDGRVLLLSDPLQADFAAKYEEQGWRYDPSTDTVTIPWVGGSQRIRFTGSGHDGDLIGVFAEKSYNALDVSGRVVLDIGANIGDSSTYFALKGARKVIAIEPFPSTYALARKNVELNRVTDQVVLLLAACGGGERTITMPWNKRTSLGSLAVDHSGLAQVSMRTISNLVREFNITSGVLKLDCEGCEYEAIGSTDASTLREFDQIQIEFHYGVGSIPGKLSSAGFKVVTTKPRTLQFRDQERPMQRGWIYARRGG